MWGKSCQTAAHGGATTEYLVQQDFECGQKQSGIKPAAFSL